MSTRQRFESVEAYFASTTPEVRGILEEIRTIIERRVPEATATIAYQMPAFRLGRIFIYFAGFKKHIGIYPPVQGDAPLTTELLPFRGEKGNLRFPLDRPMPYELIGRVADALAQQSSTR